MLGYGCAVQLGGIGGILVPAVLGEFFVQCEHVLIAMGFGEDAGGCDGFVLAIAFDDAMVRQLLVFVESVAVYQQLLRANFQAIDGAVHGQKRGVEDVDFVYLLMRGGANAPCKGFGLYDLPELVAMTLAKLFGIVEQRVTKTRGQNNCGSIHRACEASTAGFITASFNGVFGVVAFERH